MEYATDLFDSGTIERLAGNFKTLLEGVAAEADRPISELPLLSEAERRLLLEEWNETTGDYSKEKCIHQLFEEQAERTPDAAAVAFEDQSLTYRESTGGRTGWRVPAGLGAGRRRESDLHGAVIGDGGGAAGHIEGGRSVRAARSVLSG